MAENPLLLGSELEAIYSYLPMVHSFLVIFKIIYKVYPCSASNINEGTITILLFAGL